MVIWCLYDSKGMGGELRAVHYIFTVKHKRLKAEYKAGFVELNLNNIYSFADLLDTIIHEEIHKVIASVTNGRTSAEADHFIMRGMEPEFW
mgnify:FL=1